MIVYLHNGISYTGKMTSLYLFAPTGLRRVLRSLYMQRNTSIYMYNVNSKVRQAILNVMMLLWIGTIMVLPFVPKVNNRYHFNILIPYITDCGPNNPERSYFDNTIYIYIFHILSGFIVDILYLLKFMGSITWSDIKHSCVCHLWLMTRRVGWVQGLNMITVSS